MEARILNNELNEYLNDNVTKSIKELAQGRHAYLHVAKGTVKVAA